MTTDCAHANVDILKNGDLSSLRWLQSPLTYGTVPKCSTRDLYDVYYAALNFRDVMLATGKLSPDALPGSKEANYSCALGMEFSGRDRRGRRVMGILPARVRNTY